MDLQTLQTFLGWCVILNFAVMMYLFVVIAFNVVPYLVLAFCL